MQINVFHLIVRWKLITRNIFIWRENSRFSAHTGWPKSKFLISNGYNSETKHFRPHVGKAKMRLRGGSFFRFSKKFSAVCLQFFKKTTTSQTHFGFTNMGSEMHSFRVVAKINFKFWFGLPCIIMNLRMLYFRRHSVEF